MKSIILISTLVVGVVLGMGLGDYKSINCEQTDSPYCKPLGSSDTRRSF